MTLSKLGAGGMLLICLAFLPAHAQVDDPNVCDTPGESPDVVVGAIDQTVRWGVVDGVTAFSIATWSCNVGTCELQWQSDTNEHPVIGQNMFRLRNGRFEQIGQSWLKHGFFALSLQLCDEGCVPTDGDTLGVRCADPYAATLNGSQEGLGPKFEVNASTGEFPYPFTGQGLIGDPIYKRLQVHDTDLDPLRNTGALYFVEAQYVTRDDAAAGNDANNASHRQVVVFQQDGLYDIDLIGETVRRFPAIYAWAAQDPDVLISRADVARYGRFVVGSKALQVAADRWAYEYAVHNLNSHLSARAFTVPIPAGATIEAVGFHDVDYHSGEPWDGTDWTAEIVDGPGQRFIRWSTDTFDENPNANALRWGTLYNFRFEADVGPSPGDGSASIGLFRPGFSSEVVAQVRLPGPCDVDGTCDVDEDCETCPEDCLGPPPSEYCCGDGVCDPGEDECSCTADCGPCLVPCDVPADCDDGLVCNGTEDCVDGFCAAGDPPCGSDICDEPGVCYECIFSDGCDDGIFCNGAEMCVDSACVPGESPCPDSICVEAAATCVDCLDDTDCDDGLFCNGIEACEGDACTVPPPSCPQPLICDEEADRCYGCTLDRCDDGQFCNGAEECIEDRCEPGLPPCAGACDELHDVCLPAEALQPRPGEPLNGLGEAALERFEAGRDAFRRALTEPEGLGPIYNATACADCHRVAAGGDGPGSVMRFGYDDGVVFDPLSELGGSLLQELAIRPECAETVPPEANVAAPRIPTSVLGAGLIGAIDESDLALGASGPPPGISGRANLVPLLEDLGTVRIGRYGLKAQQASVLSMVADQVRDEHGLTNRLLDVENAPNGDAALLAQCDAVADPEDGPDAFGYDFVDRAADYLRFLAPPPQTPRFRMSGEQRFLLIGCADCHRILYETPSPLPDEPDLGGRRLKPYSDFLLHDMGANGDPTAQGDALPGEVRTTPLWGLRTRERLWHDGRFDQPDFDERVRAAIAAHDAPGSEAGAAAQAFAELSPALQRQVVTFLDSMGRAEFDADGDGAISASDYADFLGCFTGPVATYDADDACAVHDVDMDGDVDDDDYVLFVVAFDGRFGGAVPDGRFVPGEPLRVDREDGQVRLTWSPSCVAGDTDYAVYQGNLGDWDSHFRWFCSTGGATTAALPTAPGNVYYLVVPTNGHSDGSYGRDGAGIERRPAIGPQACNAQWLAGTCD